MTTTAQPVTVRGAPMDMWRKTAFVAGALYLLTFVSSIPAVFLLNPVLNNPGYILGSGADTQVVFGVLLDVVNALAAVGTAVTLFPLLKRQNEGVALGLVTSRLLEAAIIFIGVVSLLAVVTLRQTGAAGADAATLLPVGQALVTVRDWTFLLGPGVIPAVNALLLGTLLYRSRLVPRVLPVLGLIGAPLLISAKIGIMFGINETVSAWSVISVVPIFVWELSLGIWLVVKGFKPAPILTVTQDRPLPVG